MKQMQKILVVVLLFTVAVQTVSAQEKPEDLDKLIREKDSLFWQAYNNCDVPVMSSLFTDDIEFYHDKGGITNGRSALTASLQKNLCSNPDYHLRRAAIPETVKVFPMMSGGKVYGALISGEHLFYITDKGKPEYLDGHARFTQLWVISNNVWQMSRILSYDHQPAQYKAERKEIKLAAAVVEATKQ